MHAVFVSKAAGEFLKMHARGKEGECCIFPSAEDAAWTVLLISFISFLVILSVLAALLIARYHRLYRRGTNQQSVGIDTKMVEVLPSFTFSSACASSCHKGETCPICLEDYRDGEILRVLPCQHGKKFAYTVSIVLLYIVCNASYSVSQKLLQFTPSFLGFCIFKSTLMCCIVIVVKSVTS